MNIEIREIKYGSHEYQATLDLRYKILRKPLGLQFTPAELKQDENDLHIAAFYQDELVGCLILTFQTLERVRMRQVAVNLKEQGKGVGKELVQFTEHLLRSKGVQEIVLNARKTAIPFYLKLGYEITGEPFEEVKIPHSKMRKILI